MRRARSIEEALNRAELDHRIGCPNAELTARLGAFILDLILLFIMVSGIRHITILLVEILEPPILSSYIFYSPTRFLQFLGISAALCVIYFYLIWTSMRFGGSPAKLLMGIRVIDIQSGRWLGGYQLFLRELVVKPLGLLLLIGPLVALFRKDRRSLQDWVVGSAVKRLEEET